MIFISNIHGFDLLIACFTMCMCGCLSVEKYDEQEVPSTEQLNVVAYYEVLNGVYGYKSIINTDGIDISHFTKDNKLWFVLFVKARESAYAQIYFKPYTISGRLCKGYFLRSSKLHDYIYIKPTLPDSSALDIPEYSYLPFKISCNLDDKDVIDIYELIQHYMEDNEGKVIPGYINEPESIFAKLIKSPIFNIQCYGDEEGIRVHTAIHRCPLAGIGYSYKVVKEDGKWKISSISLWVS